MTNTNLKNFLDFRMHEILVHYEKAKHKYEPIWDYYAKNMPICISMCQEKSNQFQDKPSREGPQGIYWIGETPKIFIVGREHFGWYGSSNWQSNRDYICYSPIEFAFFTVPSMGSYWATVKDLLCEVLSIDISSWDSILANSAFSNSCKCLSNKNSYNWILHQQCFEIGYCRKEIEIVQAPVNILFTKSINLAKRMFSENTTEIESTNEFLVLKTNDQIIIECAHPGRQSNDWRQRLKEIAKKYTQ